MNTGNRGPSRCNRCRTWLFTAIVALGGTALLLLVLELGVRVAMPGVNAQDTDRSLFRENAFGKSVGWVPNAHGRSFGVDVTMDESGFRKINAPARALATWLFLGDSVTFGVGVPDDQVFAQLIQDRLETVRIRNSAVVGHSVVNYADAARYVLQTAQQPERVVMVFCLNDVYGNLDLVPREVGFVARALGFLRRYSRLYVFIKDAATDRSKAYFQYDYEMYRDDREEWRQAMVVIEELAAELRRHRIAFDVVLLPYEYQLRMNDGELLRPQRMVGEQLRSKGVHVVDLYDDFAGTMRDSRDFFLYGDPMHLSPLGHRLVGEALVRRLPSQQESRRAKGKT